MRAATRTRAALAGLPVAALAAACGTCARPGPNRDDDERNRMGNQECREAIEALVTGALARARGLPAGCTLEEIGRVLQPIDGDGTGALGEPSAPRAIRYFRAEGRDEPVRAWLDGERVVLVDLDDPATPGGWKAYVDPLGPPEARLDYAWDIFTLAGAEWLWPSRGVVVAVKADVGVVLRAGIFAPGTLDAYRKDARFISQEREEE